MNGGRLRITCVICSLAIGGAQRNLLRLAEGLSIRGNEVIVLTLDPFGPDFYKVPTGVQRLRANPAAFWGRSWMNVPANLRRFRALKTSILDTRPDVVISFIDTTNIDVLMALRNAPVPVIVSERVDPRYHRIGWIRHWMRWWLYPGAARVVLVARASLGWAKRHIPRWTATVIDNPVVTAETPVQYQADARTIVTMGRLVAQKGYDLLIAAFARIAGDCPGWTLAIIGEGPARDQIKKLIEQYGLANRVELVGARKDPFTLMSQSSFFVLSSRYEGFPMALAEAMALGLPVISFDCPSGPRVLVRPEVDGVLVPAQDVDGLAAAMRRLIEDAPLRRRLSGKAPEVTERFSLTTFVDQWSDVIQETVRVRQ
jgi:GalNAc-alpha-(1->4)-GalNAc-alpha-(1->3)-diNAcBac-PP-undecaprenol alpha-1,4-N-acetyl-D-galactosaminyltransferase